MSCLSDKLNALMREMESQHQKKGWLNFISDGAVTPDVYEKAQPKIVFFLKEAYSSTDDGGRSLTEWLNKGAMTRMWGTVAEWTYGIKNTTVTTIAAKPQLSREEKTALIQSVAVVNVKKSNGKKKSDYEDLLTYVEADRSYLKQELDILSPDVIVCGYNSGLLRALYGATIKGNKVLADGIIDAEFMQKNGYAIVGNQIIIDFYHPANFYPAMLNYYAVCSLYQQALKHKK